MDDRSSKHDEPLHPNPAGAPAALDRAEWFRLIADFTYDWEYWLMPDGRYGFVSPSCKRITGYAPEEFMRDSSLLLRIIHPEDRHIMERHLAQKHAGQEVREIDFRIITRDHAERWIGHVCRPVHSSDGIFLGWRGSNRDVTDRKQAAAEREQLLAQARRDREEIERLAATLTREWDILQTIMENTHANLAYLDANFCFVRVNSAYARHSGHSEDELLGRYHFDLFPNEENREIFERVRDTGEGVEFRAKPFEFVDQPERGVTYWDWTLVPVKDPAGRVRGLVFSLLDVSDKIRTQQALRRQNEALQELTRELDAYAHTVAHDLKQPLSGLVGFASLLEEDLATLEAHEIAFLVDKIVNTGDKMTQIVDSLLLLASARQEDVEVEPLAMGDVVREALKTVAPAIKASGADIAVPDRWPSALGFAPWVESVWTNYISNALKYGGTPPRITLGYSRGEEAESKTQFWVRDNGAGLTPQAQAQLFNTFARLDRPHTLGHGLGLTIVRRIVTRLGGQVGVNSEPGTGSTFWFTLPV